MPKITCKGCGQELDEDQFSKNGVYTRVRCKQCTALNRTVLDCDPDLSIGGIRCCACRAFKPVDQFGMDRRKLNGYRAYCKACESKAKAKTYKPSDGSRLAARNESIKAYQNSIEYHMVRLAQKFKQTRRKAQRDAIKAAKQRGAIYGAKYADEYARDILSLKFSAGRDTGVKVRVIKSEYGVDVDPTQMARIESLNRICGLPLLSIGWSCMRCGLKNDAPNFFDIEHINERCRGGVNKFSNLQLLCPNCHRLKTLGIGMDKSANFKVVTPEMERWFNISPSKSKVNRKCK